MKLNGSSLRRKAARSADGKGHVDAGQLGSERGEEQGLAGPRKCDIYSCRRRTSGDHLHRCAGRGCIKLIHQACYEEHVRTRNKLQHLPEDAMVCTKKCYTKVSNGNPQVKRSWYTDGAEGPEDPECSAAILVKWLTENYAKFDENPKTRSQTKLKYATEVAELMKSKGVVVYRDANSITKKIQHIERLFANAQAWIDSDDGRSALEDGGEEAFEDLVLQKCPHYFELKHVMEKKVSGDEEVDEAKKPGGDEADEDKKPAAKRKPVPGNEDMGHCPDEGEVDEGHKETKNLKAASAGRSKAGLSKALKVSVAAPAKRKAAQQTADNDPAPKRPKAASSTTRDEAFAVVNGQSVVIVQRQAEQPLPHQYAVQQGTAHGKAASASTGSRFCPIAPMPSTLYPIAAGLTGGYQTVQVPPAGVFDSSIINRLLENSNFTKESMTAVTTELREFKTQNQQLRDKLETVTEELDKVTTERDDLKRQVEAYRQIALPGNTFFRELRERVESETKAAVASALSRHAQANQHRNGPSATSDE